MYTCTCIVILRCSMSSEARLPGTLMLVHPFFIQLKAHVCMGAHAYKLFLLVGPLFSITSLYFVNYDFYISVLEK